MDLLNALVASGRFVDVVPLAIGGQGRVYRARDTLFDEVVVLKAALEDGHQDAIRREFRNAARLRHPNVARVRDLLDLADQPVLMSRYVDGLPLDQSPEVDPHALARDLFAGLAALHARGLVHADVAPPNIIRATDGAHVLIDMALGLDRTSALVGPASGRPTYWAPEHHHRRPLTPATDVFAAALVAYEALARALGQSWWTDSLRGAALGMAPLPPVGADPDLTRLLDAALHEDASRRPTAAALAAELGATDVTDAGAALEVDARVRSWSHGDRPALVVLGGPGTGKSRMADALELEQLTGRAILVRCAGDLGRHQGLDHLADALSTTRGRSDDPALQARLRAVAGGRPETDDEGVLQDLQTTLVRAGRPLVVVDDADRIGAVDRALWDALVRAGVARWVLFARDPSAPLVQLLAQAGTDLITLEQAATGVPALPPGTLPEPVAEAWALVAGADLPLDAEDAMRWLGGRVDWTHLRVLDDRGWIDPVDGRSPLRATREGPKPPPDRLGAVAQRAEAQGCPPTIAIRVWDAAGAGEPVRRLAPEVVERLLAAEQYEQASVWLERPALAGAFGPPHLHTTLRARASAGTGAPRVAAARWLEAAATAPDEGVRLQALSEAAEALLGCGASSEGEDALVRLCREVSLPLPRSRWTAWLRVLADALSPHVRGLRLAERRTPDGGRLAAASTAAATLVFQDAPTAIATILRYQREALAAGDPVHAVRAVAVEWVHAAQSGRRDARLEACRAFIDQHREGASRETLAFLDALDAYAEVFGGRIAEAEAGIERALRAYAAHERMRWERRLLLAHRPIIRHFVGASPERRESWQLMLADLRRIGDELSACVAELGAGWAWDLVDGDVEAARARIDRCEGTFDRVPAAVAWNVALARTRLALYRDDADEALAHWRTARRVAADLKGLQHIRVTLAWTRGLIAARRGGWREGWVLADSIRRLEREEGSWGRGHAPALRASRGEVPRAEAIAAYAEQGLAAFVTADAGAPVADPQAWARLYLPWGPSV